MLCPATLLRYGGEDHEGGVRGEKEESARRGTRGEEEEDVKEEVKGVEE